MKISEFLNLEFIKLKKNIKLAQFLSDFVFRTHVNLCFSLILFVYLKIDLDFLLYFLPNLRKSKKNNTSTVLAILGNLKYFEKISSQSPSKKVYENLNSFNTQCIQINR